MSIELQMPALSPTMEKGTLAKWRVAEGDEVGPGDVLAEIETDKATMELEANDTGYVAALLVAEGSDDVPVGTTIALLTAEPPTVQAPAAKPAPAPAAVEPAALAAPEPNRPAPPAHVEPASAPPPRQRPDERITVSPLAARIAKALNIDLSALRGSGPGGRIVRADLGLGPRTPAAAQTAPQVEAISPPPGVPLTSLPLSGMRKRISERLTEAKRDMPHFYLTAKCNIQSLAKLRSDLNASLSASDSTLSINDLLMKAMALALVEVPDANVQYGGNMLHRFERVDLSMAVAIEGGLVAPVIRGIDTLSLSAIAKQSKALAARARAGSLAPEEYQGGTASVSNLGKFGIDAMVPVLNPPQALILGIAAVREIPWNVDGALALAPVVAVTGSFDHRAIDGATGAKFMRVFRSLVENPLALCA